MRLSIIVPAFKVEAYIERCLRSLEDQDISKTDYEIIVTNDGSPDRSREIVEKLQAEFPNIILINQENQGVSVARNNAIAKAKGKYILLIDPDDYVLPNTFNAVLAIAENKDLDVLYLGFEIFGADGKSQWHTDYSEQQVQVYNGIEAYFASRGPNVRDPDRSWAILYRRDLLEKYQIRYPEKVPFLEDGVFISKVAAMAEKVGFDNRKFHQRTTSQGSATVSGVYYSDKAIDGFIISINDLKGFSKAHAMQGKNLGLMNHAVAKYTILALTAAIGTKKIPKYLQLISRLKQNQCDKINTNGLRLDYRNLAKAYNFSALFFYAYYLFSAKLKAYKR